jgi:hypothetical protein
MHAEMTVGHHPAPQVGGAIAPPQWSPDGRWWWDGNRWIPRERALVNGVPPPRRRLPWEHWPVAARAVAAVLLWPVAVYLWVLLSGWRRPVKAGAVTLWSMLLLILLLTHLPSASSGPAVANGILAPQPVPAHSPPSLSGTPQPTISLPPLVVSTPTPVLPCHADAPPNPFGFDFCPGQLITAPPANLCDYFRCVHGFWHDPPGVLVECRDGTYSRSGGHRGACSRHGGVLQAVYAH